jgi:hypothetical protein
MGKTTVSWSIIRASRRATEGKYPEGLKDYIKLLSNRVVWLEPIDMPPLPDPTNLLAAVLARIDSTAGTESRLRPMDKPGEPARSVRWDGLRTMKRHCSSFVVFRLRWPWPGTVTFPSVVPTWTPIPMLSR